MIKIAYGQDLLSNTIAAKSGDIITATSKFPTTAIKIDAKEIVKDKLIILKAIEGGHGFAHVLTDIPIMDTVMVDSLTVTAEGDTVMVPVSAQIHAFTVRANGDTVYAYRWKGYQCSWIEYKVDKDNKKIIRLIDIDGSEATVPIEKVLGVFK